LAEDEDEDGETVYEEAGLTFGEFCFFATELMRACAEHERASQRKSRASKSNPVPILTRPPPVARCRSELATSATSSRHNYDVFLGGSCNPTVWRQEIAIPFLKDNGITFYNPQTTNWVPEMIELEHQAKQTSKLLLFVLNDRTRNVVSMIEVAYLAGAGRRIIPVLGRYPRVGHTIGGEELSAAESSDLNGAMTTVNDLVERTGTPVFSDMLTALAAIRKVLIDGVDVTELGLNDGVRPVRFAHLQVGEAMVRLRKSFDTLDTQHAGRIGPADLKLAYRTYARKELSQADMDRVMRAHDSKDQALTTIDFDHYCCITSEFKNARRYRKSRAESGSGTTTTANARGKATLLLKKAVISPLSRISGWVGGRGCGSSSSEHPRRTQRRKRTHDEESAATVPPLVTLSTAVSLRGGRKGVIQTRDVYLGGTTTCRGTANCTWREDVAIPALRKQGLTFYSSAVAAAARRGRLIPLEAAAMDNSHVLLYVILGTSRSVGVMCEAAYHIGRGANVVLCLQNIPEGASLDGIPATKSVLKDYNRGRAYLSDMANREGVPVFEDVAEAVECVLRRCKSLSGSNDGSK